MSTNAPVQSPIAIVNGPTDRDIMLSFMYMYDENADVRVKFTVQEGRLKYSILAKVAAVAYESGQRGQLLIELRTQGKVYKGYYDANKRRGTLSLMK